MLSTGGLGLGWMNWIQDWWSFDWRLCPSPRYFRYSDFQNWPGCCSRTSLSSWVMVLIKIILHVIIDKRIKFRQELTQLRHINVPPKIINFSHGRRYWTGKDILTNFTFFTDFSEFLLLFISTNIINSMFSNVGKVILGFLIIVNTRNHNLIVGEILVTVQTLADSLKICLMVGFFWLLRVQSKSPLLTLTSNSSSNDLLFSKSSFWQGEKTCSGAGGEADLSSGDGVFLVTGVKGPQELWPKFQVLD